MLDRLEGHILISELNTHLHVGPYPVSMHLESLIPFFVINLYGSMRKNFGNIIRTILLKLKLIRKES
jgi:hypothetical protein